MPNRRFPASGGARRGGCGERGFQHHRPAWRNRQGSDPAPAGRERPLRESSAPDKRGCCAGIDMETVRIQRSDYLTVSLRWIINQSLSHFFAMEKVILLCTIRTRFGCNGSPAGRNFCGKFCKKKRKVQIYSAMIGRAVILFNIYYSRRERMMPRPALSLHRKQNNTHHMSPKKKQARRLPPKAADPRPHDATPWPRPWDRSRKHSDVVP